MRCVHDSLRRQEAKRREQKLQPLHSIRIIADEVYVRYKSSYAIQANTINLRSSTQLAKDARAARAVMTEMRRDVVKENVLFQFNILQEIWRTVYGGI